MRTILLIFAAFMSTTALAQNQEIIRYECNLQIFKPQAAEPTLSMNGVVELPLAGDGSAYLTLEPPLLSHFDVSARILLTRFEGENYFPMILHPRGETADYLKFQDLNGETSARLAYTDKSGNTFSVTCLRD